jgi:hypothetical protein
MMNPDDVKLLGRVITHILDRIEAEGVDVLLPAERVVYMAYFLDAEVHNGGFDQYFFNSQGDYSAETVEALEAVGAARSAGLLRRARSVFKPEAPSPNRNARWEQMDRMPKEIRAQWQAMDAAYWAPGEDVMSLLCAYVRARPEAFER